MKTKLEILREEVKKIEQMQRECTHDWEEPKRDTIEKPIRETQRLGVDYVTAITGYETVPCWSRTCRKCGKKEYTEKMEEVAVKTIRRPKF